MSHLTTSQLAAKAGITRRQLQRLLDGGDVPELGAVRTPGGHWRIPDSPAATKWAKGFKRWAGKGNAKKSGLNRKWTGGITDKSVGFLSIEGISMSFDLWHRGMQRRMQMWDVDKVDKAIKLLSRQARVHAELVAMSARLKRGE
jgi:hypothetical protein